MYIYLCIFMYIYIYFYIFIYIYIILSSGHRSITPALTLIVDLSLTDIDRGRSKGNGSKGQSLRPGKTRM